MKIFEFDLAEDEVLMTKLQKYLPIFFDLVVCLLCKRLPDDFKDLVSTLIRVSQVPFEKALPVQGSTAPTESPYNVFPSMPVCRERGKFEADKLSEVRGCTKRYKKHRNLMPGIFTVYCIHGKYCHLNHRFTRIKLTEFTPNLVALVFI